MIAKEYFIEECDFCGKIKRIRPSLFGCCCEHCWETIKDEVYKAITRRIESLVEEQA